MFQTRLIVSVVEFLLSISLAIFVVFWSYKSFIAAESYDVVDELKKGNVAVATLLTSIMFATSLLMQQTVYPVTSILALYLHTKGQAGVSFLRVLAYCAGHLVLGFLLSIGAVELSLRMFEKLVAGVDGINDEEELRRGNTAVAIVMAGVVLVTAFYLQEGISGLTKSLIPQPSLGDVRIFH